MKRPPSHKSLRGEIEAVSQTAEIAKLKEQLKANGRLVDPKPEAKVKALGAALANQPRKVGG
jgi:hypothetical protein